MTVLPAATILLWLAAAEAISDSTAVGRMEEDSEGIGSAAAG
jgi:hypothetical protein